MSLALLRRLLRQPHQLQWQRMRLPYPLDDEVTALLPQLPSLTAISGTARCGDFGWLRCLPNLTDVDLAFSHREDVADRAAALVAGLQHCTNIEVLALSGSSVFLQLSGCTDLTAAHLADLLPRLPRLRGLSLDFLGIDSLAFLAQPPMTSQLSILCLRSCSQLPPTELRRIHSLRGLEYLNLSDSFSAPLDSAALALLEPPSAVLPRLDDFWYSAAD